jgi:hypothetical protein
MDSYIIYAHLMFLRYQIKEDEIVEAFIALKRGQKL